MNMRLISDLAGADYAVDCGFRFVKPTRPASAIPHDRLDQFRSDRWMWQPKFDGSHKVFSTAGSDRGPLVPFCVFTRHGDWRCMFDGDQLLASGPQSMKMAQCLLQFATAVPAGVVLSLEWLDKAKTVDVYEGESYLPEGFVCHDVLRWPGLSLSSPYLERMGKLHKLAVARGVRPSDLPGTISIDGMRKARMIDLDGCKRHRWGMEQMHKWGPLYEGVVIRDMENSKLGNERSIFKCRHANNVVAW